MIQLFLKFMELIILKLFNFIKNCFFKTEEIEIVFNQKKKIFNSNEISIISYNIKQLLHWTLVHEVNLIIQFLKKQNTTIICLQEVFCDKSKKLIIKNLADMYPYIIKRVNTKALYGWGEDSGLMILSKIPFYKNKIYYDKFDNGVKSDKFANKGYIKILLEFNQNKFWLINTHLQSNYDNIDYSNIRKQQIDKIKVHNDNVPTLLIGDLNIKCFSQEFYSYDWQTLYKNNQYTFLEDKAIYDYILLLNSNSLFRLKNITIKENINLSDHYPIITTLEC